MSLVQHVSAVEGPDRFDLASLYDPPDNASLQLGRRLSLTLSYDPLPKIDGTQTEKLEPVAAYKISTAKRIGKRAVCLKSINHSQLSAQVVVGVTMCVLASGIVFGFAALKQILVEERVYRDLCTREELERGEMLCYLQDQR